MGLVGQELDDREDMICGAGKFVLFGVFNQL
jgi:hypothetical protein